MFNTARSWKRKVDTSRAARNACLAQDWPLYDPEAPCLVADPNLPPSVNRVRRRLNEALREGGVCPVCGRSVKVYPNDFRWSLALLLQHVRQSGDVFGWFHLPTVTLDIPGLTASARAAARLAGSRTEGWRVLERGEERGWWRLTLTGLMFVDEELWVPSRMYTFNNVVVGYGPELVGFSKEGLVRFDPMEDEDDG